MPLCPGTGVAPDDASTVRYLIFISPGGWINVNSLNHSLPPGICSLPTNYATLAEYARATPIPRMCAASLKLDEQHPASTLHESTSLAAGTAGAGILLGTVLVTGDTDGGLFPVTR